MGWDLTFKTVVVITWSIIHCADSIGNSDDHASEISERVSIYFLWKILFP